MDEFYKSGYGRIFFEQQLPSLIQGIQSLTTQLERANDLEQKKGTVKSAPVIASAISALGLSTNNTQGVYQHKGIEDRQKADGTSYKVDVIIDDQGREFTRFVNVATISSGPRTQKRP